ACATAAWKRIRGQLLSAHALGWVSGNEPYYKTLLRTNPMVWLTLLIGLLLLVMLVALSPWWLGAKGRRSIKMALRNLLLHKLRAFLSVLGIIIGTASVIVLMAF